MSKQFIMAFMDAWAVRSIQRELLDTAAGADREASLRDLTRINRFLGGHRILRQLLAPLVRRGDAFTVLDVGAASGDMSRVVLRAFPRASVVCFDLSPSHLAAAPPPCIAGDAFSLPFAPRSFDFVFSSLFLHHFENARVASLLEGFGAIARNAVLAIDLERGPLGYHFLPATRWLFGWNRVTLHDGPVSVQAGFRRQELLDLAHAAGLDRASVRRHDPWCRLSLLAPVGQPLE